MRLRHAAALALVLLVPVGALAGGWYLMAPPTRADIDPSCTGNVTLGDRIRAFYYNQTNSAAQFNRCLPETEALADGALLSRWYQAGSYETVKDCEWWKNAMGRTLAQGQEGTFLSVHKKDYQDYFGGIEKHEEEESNLCEKDKLWKEEYSRIPKEVRDEADAYQAGKFNDSDQQEKSSSNDRVTQLQMNFLLTHRDKYPALARLYAWVAASAEIDEKRGLALRCVATDDPRLKEK